MINCVYTFLPLGGGGVMWTKLQEVLSSVEDSISCKRSWAAPITASDQDKHQEHLRAAQESWVKATQVLKTFFFFREIKKKKIFSWQFDVFELLLLQLKIQQKI